MAAARASKKIDASEDFLKNAGPFRPPSADIAIDLSNSNPIDLISLTPRAATASTPSAASTASTASRAAPRGAPDTDSAVADLHTYVARRGAHRKERTWGGDVLYYPGCCYLWGQFTRSLSLSFTTLNEFSGAAACVVVRCCSGLGGGVISGAFSATFLSTPNSLAMAGVSAGVGGAAVPQEKLPFKLKVNQYINAMGRAGSLGGNGFGIMGTSPPLITSSSSLHASSSLMCCVGVLVCYGVGWLICSRVLCYIQTPDSVAGVGRSNEQKNKYRRSSSGRRHFLLSK